MAPAGHREGTVALALLLAKQCPPHLLQADDSFSDLMARRARTAIRLDCSVGGELEAEHPSEQEQPVLIARLVTNLVTTPRQPPTEPAAVGEGETPDSVATALLAL